ncbi:MAG TPA: siderophore-interacting protein [Solirubrobacter sp.]|nr:siderophore-interacting protein [Solirubrobacter sp.]
MVERFPRRAGVATLVARRRLTPRMLRVTLRCDGFGAGWPIEQPGEIITLLFVPPGTPVVLPQQGWTFPPGVAQDWRNYTVRRHRPEAGEIDVDVVLHEPRGPACTWAERVPVGAAVGYAGPRVDFRPHADADWLLLCGDETALPAIAAILEAAPDRDAVAVVEVADGGEALALDPRLRYVHRSGAPAATTSHLPDALRALAIPHGRVQAWGAAESGVARELRSILRDEHGLPRAHATAKGYWLRRN